MDRYSLQDISQIMYISNLHGDTSRIEHNHKNKKEIQTISDREKLCILWLEIFMLSFRLLPNYKAICFLSEFEIFLWRINSQLFTDKLHSWSYEVLMEVFLMVLPPCQYIEWTSGLWQLVKLKTIKISCVMNICMNFMWFMVIISCNCST